MSSQDKPQPKLTVNSIEEIKEDQKTQLENTYNVWMTGKHHQVKEYENVLKKDATFSTIEDFWAIYEHTRRPLQMTFGSLIHVFVDGVKPMWEDESCKDGGRWVIRVPKSHSNKYWEELLLAMIGEQFQQSNEVLGLVISLKPYQDIISIWNRNGTNQEKVQSLKEDIERILQPDSEVKIDYEIFEVEKIKAEERKASFANKQPEDGGWAKQQDKGETSGGHRGGFYRGRGGRGGRGGHNH